MKSLILGAFGAIVPPMTDAQDKDQYKDTVFLPKTDFPMRGELPKKEPEILKKWQEMDIYAQLEKKNAGKDTFILHDGPPYANGHIHIGHALNKILKDVVIKTQQSQGKHTPYVPGWDCHGLPIEWKIEEQYREKGLNKDDVNIVDFRAECREFAQKWVGVQVDDFQRLGVFGDFKNPYLTLDFKAEGKIAREIHKFLKNGLLYRGAKPVMWSVVEKTALAEAEVEYKEHKSITVWVKFPVRETKAEALKGTSIVIWTTTPWTLPSNRALAFSKNIEYGVFEITEIAEGSKATLNDKIVLSVKLAEGVKQSAKIINWKQIATIKGTDIADTICDHPLRSHGYSFDVPALEGDFVTEEVGTGFVHIAPSHGEDDYFLYIKHFGAQDLPDNVTDDGKYREHMPLFAGMEIYTQKGEIGEGNFVVLKELERAGALLAKGSVKHEYPHSWRSKAPLIFRTTPQWFIAMDKAINGGDTLRASALKGISSTKWVPAAGENRIRAMIESRTDWCISRQRTWGVPIALFVDKKTGVVLEDDAVLNRIGDIFEAEGADAWWARPAQDFLGNDYKAEDFEQVFDIVDIWFESGCTHTFVLDKPDSAYPVADLYLEGSDQHRGWFHSSLLESCGTRGKPPYKSVLTHGFILDEKGYKMSKSQGNVVAPQTIIDQYGADILRLWCVMSDYAEDVRIGNDIIKQTADIYRRFRNTFRYLLGALDGFTDAEHVTNIADMPELERYVLARIAALEVQFKDSIAGHDYGDIIKGLHDFCNSFLSSFYFDIRKDSLYCDRADDITRRSCRTVMAHLFDYIVLRLAPVLAFTAEEAWGHSGRTGSVHLQSVSAVPANWDNPTLIEKWASIEDIRKSVLAELEPQRAQKIIASSLEAAPEIHVTADMFKNISGLNMADICITSAARIMGDASATSVNFAKAEGSKCNRCWKILPEVGAHKDHPTLCNRCADAVDHHFKNQKAA